MTPEEQQYQWMRNRAALAAMKYTPEDIAKWSNYGFPAGMENLDSPLGGPMEANEQLYKQMIPYNRERNQAVLKAYADGGKPTKEQLAVNYMGWNSAEINAVGKALRDLFVGTDLTPKPAVSFRATPPTLR
jgi:hypothetical protein